ncbi:MAG: hypothetical protein GM43_5210 [actinobacterium acMicro-4]|nr:MAG: hypothetical protein GM43_5210 [actinobacterium acMicro-4]
MLVVPDFVVAGLVVAGVDGDVDAGFGVDVPLDDESELGLALADFFESAASALESVR